MSNNVAITKQRRSTIVRALDERGSNVFDVDKDELFDIASKDDNTLTRAEYDKLHSAIAEQAKVEMEEKLKANRAAAASAKRTKLLGVATTVLVLFLGLSLAGNMMITSGIVDKQVRTTTNHGMLEVKDSNGEIAKVAKAQQNVPLVLAPVLPAEALFGIDFAVVAYMELNKTISARLSISEVRRINATYVEFATSIAGQTLVILNGEAHLEQKPTPWNGLAETKQSRVCASDVACSSFTVDGVDVEEMAMEAGRQLDAIGASSSTGRRRLAMGLNGNSFPASGFGPPGDSINDDLNCDLDFFANKVDNGVGKQSNFGVACNTKKHVSYVSSMELDAANSAGETWNGFWNTYGEEWQYANPLQSGANHRLVLKSSGGNHYNARTKKQSLKAQVVANGDPFDCAGIVCHYEALQSDVDLINEPFDCAGFSNQCSAGCASQSCNSGADWHNRVGLHGSQRTGAVNGYYDGVDRLNIWFQNTYQRQYDVCCVLECGVQGIGNHAVNGAINHQPF